MTVDVASHRCYWRCFGVPEAASWKVVSQNHQNTRRARGNEWCEGASTTRCGKEEAKHEISADGEPPNKFANRCIALLRGFPTFEASVVESCRRPAAGRLFFLTLNFFARDPGRDAQRFAS